jgi:hypothetical protein
VGRKFRVHGETFRGLERPRDGGEHRTAMAITTSVRVPTASVRVRIGGGTR